MSDQCGPLSCLEVPHIIEFLTAHSYTGLQSSGKVTVRRAATTRLMGKRVAIVENIVGSGRTLRQRRYALAPTASHEAR